jgi:hypothetical protein
MKRMVLTLVSLASVVAVPHAAPTRPQAAQQLPAPTFRTTTRLIVQTVMVKDKDGRPIEGLTAKDFIVTEDGQAQMISFVEFQRLPTAPRGAGQAPAAPVTPPLPTSANQGAAQP